MLRRCAPLLRIGAHMDPRAAGFGTNIPVDIVTGSGLQFEHGFASSRPTDAQRLVYQRQAAAAARGAVRDRLTAPNDAGVVEASPERAAALLRAGHVCEGMAMVAAFDALAPADLVKLIDALAVPDMVAALYIEADHNMFEAYKRAGSHRGTQRVREAEHLFERLQTAAAGDALADVDAADLRQGFNGLLRVYLTAGYEHVLRIPDELYDRMFFEGIQPSAQTYNAVLAALGMATRVDEAEALWRWLDGHRAALPYATSLTMMNVYAEAERFLDVSRLFHDIVLRSAPKPDAAAFDVLVRSIYQHSRHQGGAVPASEEKKLVFIPTYARQCGVHLADLAAKHQGLIDNALERWTYRRGLDKTVQPMFDQKAYEYRAWNEGQRWTHIKEDEVNTSMMEAGIRKMRGHGIDERMRLDVQKGGGRGVIYPPESHYAVTRYDGAAREKRRSVVWENLGVAQGMLGKTPSAPAHAEVAKAVQFARKASTVDRKGGGGGGVWRRGR
eukprot:TRINITY_DN5138_c2_g1_i1.p1 TRINITY_DN5138_c2_g1~~TRINITY_DN5138_c2_g1_i1.p1  ORF type:complete len:500 (+),score=164.63 TRINITY_DN5138_c2_g1_i1:91-1590(+)